MNVWRESLGYLAVCSMLWVFAVGCSCNTTPPDLCEGVTCSTGKVCKSGICVDNCDKTLCGAVCVDSKTDVKNCGGCGIACRTGEVCEAGTCKLQCETGKTICNNRCVELNLDRENCGQCGATCRQGEVCKSGKCALNCPDGTHECEGKCVDLNVSPEHCGACRNVCKTGETCKAGKCQLLCPSGQTICSDKCVDTQVDRNHCGDCGNKCKDGEVCSVGKCALSCQTSLTDCSGNCVNTQIDPKHCGKCANACPTGQLCEAGSCQCPADTTFCSGVCANIKTDAKHCGQCGNLCKTGEICVEGTCGVACKNGETNCGNVCVDLKNSTAHCGACNQACASGRGCCAGTCKDFTKDNNNCGSCGKICSAERVCTQGACACPQGLTDCSGVCVNLQNNSNHCGVCGTVCGTGTVCIAGACKPPWAVSVGGISQDSYEESYSTTRDSNGNMYVGGRFAGSILRLGTVVLSQGMQNGMFVAKLNTNLNVTQTTLASASDTMVLRGMAADRSGNVLVTGYFYGRAIFGTTTLASKGSADVFVAKINSAGQWSWATQGGGTNLEQSFAITADSSGNAYITGAYLSTSTFGSTTLTSRGGYDILVAKLDTNGNWLWTVSAGGTSSDYGYGIATDTSGNVYVTGAFFTNSAATSYATFGSFSTIKANGSSTDVFVAKLNSNGSWVWVQTAGSTNTDIGSGIAVDSSGNSYVTGYTYSGARFGASFTFNGYGNNDVFVAKLDTNGNWTWIQSAGGSGSEQGTAITLDSTGNAFVSGIFYTSGGTAVATFGSYSLKSVDNSSDAFVAKISSSGAWQWATSAGGNNTDNAYAVALDTAGNAYVSGVLYSSNALFGTHSLSGNESGDIFVAKLNSTGSITHAVRFFGETSNEDGGTDIALDKQGNIYVIGSFYGVAVFGTTTLSSERDSQDVFVAKLDPAGHWLWAKQGTGNDSEYGTGIQVDSASNVYITGYFGGGGERATSSKNFALVPDGSMVMGSFTLLSQNRDKMFVAKLDKDGNWLWAKTSSGQNSDYATSLALDSTSNMYLTGYFYGNAVFGTTTLSAPNNENVFVAKLDKDGNWLWSIQSNGGNDTQRSNKIVTDSAGDAYIAGYFYNTTTFGSTTLSSKGNADIFVTKANKAGSWAWSRSTGGTSSEQALSLAVDSSGNIFITGIFQASAVLGTTTLSSTGSTDVFVAKMDQSGNWLWAKSGGGAGNDISPGITLDASGAAYITGYVPNQATFGTLSLSAPANSRNLFVVKIDSNGNWVKSYVASSTDANYVHTGASLVYGDGGKLYVTGWFSTTAQFGSTTLTSKGNSDIFVWQILP